MIPRTRAGLHERPGRESLFAAGYFLAWGEWNRPLRWQLRGAGLAGAALLHGAYDTVAGAPLLALLVVAFTFHVLVLCIGRAAAAEGPDAALARGLA